MDNIDSSKVFFLIFLIYYLKKLKNTHDDTNNRHVHCIFWPEYSVRSYTQARKILPTVRNVSAHGCIAGCALHHLW